MIPHITNEIKRRIKLIESEDKYDIIITELGGTVGDIESALLLRLFVNLSGMGEGNSLVIHLTLCPFISCW